jgi:hypothetical protein
MEDRMADDWRALARGTCATTCNEMNVEVTDGALHILQRVTRAVKLQTEFHSTSAFNPYLGSTRIVNGETFTQSTA